MTQIMIDIDNDVMRVYHAEAAERGYASGQAIISALLADWPAILAPVQPKPSMRTTDDRLGSLENILGLALARISILENATPAQAADNYRDGENVPLGGGF